MSHGIPADRRPLVPGQHQAYVRQTQRQLARMLFGPAAPRPVSGFRVVAAGRRAESLLARTRAAFADRFQGEQSWMFGYEWPGPVTWTTQLIEYPGWRRDNPIRAVLRVPRNARRAPAVLCLHGHVRGLVCGKEETDYLAVPLAARGFVTLAPDALPFGSRRSRQYDQAEFRDLHGYGFLAERVEFGEALLRGECLMGIQLWELMRGIDLLQTLPEVDPARIGTGGCSQGGVHSWWLAALDRRIGAAVVASAVTTYKLLERDHIIHALYNYVPGVRLCGDQPQLLSLIAPRPLLLLGRAEDDSFPVAGFQEVGRWLRQVYGLYGSGRRFRQRLETGEHGFGAAAQEETMRWFERWLQRD